MTTLRSIVTKAFRESNITAAGAVPQAEEFEEALDHLKSFVKTLIGNDLGSNLTDWSYGKEGLTNSYATALDASESLRRYVPENIRIVFNAENAGTLYLHPRPQDGARLAVVDNAETFDTASIVLDGNGRKIEGGPSVALTTAGLTKEWFYRADLSEWVPVTALTANSESPFPEEFDDYLVLSLTMRLNPRYGEGTAAETVDFLRRAKSQFRARYRQTTQELPDVGLVPDSRGFGSATTRFNYGRP